MAEYSRQVFAGTIVVIVLTAFVAVEITGLYASSTSYTTSSATSRGSSAGVGETVFIRVVNSSSGEPVSNESVTAGPASSLHDVALTYGMSGIPTLTECVHEVPNGSAVFPNGGMAVSNGTTSTFALCPLKNYDTNATGWVTVSNQNTTYFFVFVGTAMNSNATNVQVIPVEASQTYVTVTFPQVNFTVSSTGESA